MALQRGKTRPAAAALTPADAAGVADGSRPDAIADRIVDAILAGRLAPGQRLGEQALADLFGVSRTLVREALMQLQARGFVEVRPRRGWYVVEPSVAEARDAFSARRIVEAGMLSPEGDPPPEGRPLQQVARALRQHIEQEREAAKTTG